MEGLFCRTWLTTRRDRLNRSGGKRLKRNANKLVELHGGSVLLRELGENHLPLLWQLIYGDADPEWKNWDAPYYPLVHKTFSQFCKERKGERGYDAIPRFGIWVDGIMVGSVGYYWEHEPSLWLEVGIALYDSNYRSCGYGREALILWVDYLFSTKQLARVGLTTWSGNSRMMRCAEKVGMRLEGRLRKCRLWQGKYYDSIRYGILREEWQELSPIGFLELGADSA